MLRRYQQQWDMKGQVWLGCLCPEGQCSCPVQRGLQPGPQACAAPAPTRICSRLPGTSSWCTSRIQACRKWWIPGRLAGFGLAGLHVAACNRSKRPLFLHAFRRRQLHAAPGPMSGCRVHAAIVHACPALLPIAHPPKHNPPPPTLPPRPGREGALLLLATAGWMPSPASRGSLLCGGGST